jgi:hypothetical protein
VPFTSHFNPISTPFTPHFNPFQPHFHPIFSVLASPSMMPCAASMMLFIPEAHTCRHHPSQTSQPCSVTVLFMVVKWRESA